MPIHRQCNYLCSNENSWSALAKGGILSDAYYGTPSNGSGATIWVISMLLSTMQKGARQHYNACPK